MDSRRCSAALGFTLLIGCVIGIVILIYNSGSTRRSSETLSTSSSTSTQHSHNHHHRTGSTTVVGGRNGGDHSVPTLKGGFANDPNYRSSQPTMQEVSELADELRLLSSKSKHVLSSGKASPVNSGIVSSMKKTNGSLASASSSATSSAKATISAVNYSSIPKKGSFGGPQPSASIVPVPATPPQSANFSSFHKNRPLTSSSVITQEIPGSHHHPGHSSPKSLPPIPPEQKAPQLTVNSRERHKAFELLSHDKLGRGGVSVGLAHNDLYTTSWHPSMVSPAGGGMVAAPNHPYHHPHPYRRPHNNNNPQQNRASSSPAKVNKTGKGTRYPLNQNQNRAPNPKQSQHGYQHHQHDHEKEEMKQEEDGDFVEADGDDDEDDVSANPGNLKKEEELDDDNDIVDDDDNEEDDEEDEEEEEEEDEDDNGANAGFLMEPKNLAADLETLVSLANHLYTSPASLLSAFSQAKNNSTMKTSSVLPPTGYPAALQGFLKVVNETIQRSNNSKLLVELNELYRGREARMSQSASNQHSNNNHKAINASAASSTSVSSGTTNTVGNATDKPETAYEKSLTAFVFMSFGVFLLNQIHSFVQKAADEHLKHNKLMNNDTFVSEGRSLPWEEKEDGPFSWYSPRSQMLMTTEASSLDILFQPPVSANISSSAAGNTSDSVSGRSSDHPSSDTDASLSTEGHVNNMFRALLNIANAYTKDSPELECIWSLYCRDLDKTAQKQGLYGVAARINSVGLRLIMRQIPPALTFDVILRSLVGWDGLPCRKMFPECSVTNGTLSMAADEDRVVTNVL